MRRKTNQIKKNYKKPQKQMNHVHVYEILLNCFCFFLIECAKQKYVLSNIDEFIVVQCICHRFFSSFFWLTEVIADAIAINRCKKNTMHFVIYFVNKFWYFWNWPMLVTNAQTLISKSEHSKLKQVFGCNFKLFRLWKVEGVAQGPPILSAYHYKIIDSTIFFLNTNSFLNH